MFFVIYAGNCQENANDLLNEIALSQDYIDYEDIKQEIIWSYVNDSFESEKIFRILDKTQKLPFAPCNLNSDGFPEVKGFELFVSLHCEYAQLKSRLRQKYDQIESMPTNTIIRLIRQYYEENYTGVPEKKASTDIKNAYLEKVAASEEYRDYRIAVENIQESTFKRLYDIEGVYKYFYVSENKVLTPCNIREDNYPDIKGFDQYVIVACNAEMKSQKLNSIYGFKFFESIDQQYTRDYFNYQIDPNGDHKFEQLLWFQIHMKDY